HLVALLGEGIFDPTRHRVFVLDDQDRCGHGRPMVARPPRATMPAARPSPRGTMPDTRPTLTAHARTVTGKAVRQLRADGLLPAVVYGHDVPSESVQVDAKAFADLSRHTSRNTLVDLEVDGSRPRRVLIYDVQHHPVTRRALHVDLFVVRMTEELTVDVPLNFVGTPPAVDKLGGTLFHAIDAIRVRALPDHLPGSIEVDIHGLATFDDAIHVRDLPIPEEVTLVTEP